MGKKVLIVGGVAGGAGTAARLRRMDENAEIILFERGNYISFANCGLPYYVGGTIKDRSELLLQTPEDMMARFNIDVRINNEVTRIDRELKEIEVLGGNGYYKEAYDVLVLSPGSTPLTPPIPGIDSPNIFSLWTVPDVDKIKTYVDDEQPRTAVVIGGGFIGIEMAENLYDLGIEVSLVEMLDQVMMPFDYDMAQMLHEHIAAKGVKLELSNGVKTFEHREGKTKVTLQDGKEIVADMVILSIGIKPNGELAKEAGLTINRRGGIVVDDYLRTSDESIYALGDVIQVNHYIDGEETMIPLAGPANRQARILANNICGAQEAYRGSQGSSVAKVFDMTAACTGYNEKALVAKGMQKKKDFDSVITISNSHAGYYPAARPMTLKVIFDKAGKILGAQGVGYDGVDKRIDVIATAIRFRGTVDDLKDLELAYAPPYSSAKDPVNMAGFVADNVLSGVMGSISWDEMEYLDPETTQILDVRNAGECKRGIIEGSLQIPIDELRERLGELDKEKEVIIYCAVGIRGYIGTRILTQHGFRTRNLLGGYIHYRRTVKNYNL
jgi:NADPH-dependent 2,4-dienoyl-CoA reductase/sulfur reductase-like enzyme/rhodanese-related sulfurtransferase